MLMRFIKIFFGLLFCSNVSFGQTATNFNVNDCVGNPHDLFAELNASKVIVLVWVMPCASCIGPSLTAYNVVQSYSVSNPGQVLYYLCDDHGDSPCSTINTWANTNGLINTTRFSNSAISMADYGGDYMPKMVVLGTSNHTVFSIQDVTFNASTTQTAINNALAAILAGVNEREKNMTSLNVFPVPAKNNLNVSFTLNSSSNAKIEIMNVLGEKIKIIDKGNLAAGKNETIISTEEFKNGVYILRVITNGKSSETKFVVNN